MAFEGLYGHALKILVARPHTEHEIRTKLLQVCLRRQKSKRASLRRGMWSMPALDAKTKETHYIGIFRCMTAKWFAISNEVVNNPPASSRYMSIEANKLVNSPI